MVEAWVVGSYRLLLWPAAALPQRPRGAAARGAVGAATAAAAVDGRRSAGLGDRPEPPAAVAHALGQQRGAHAASDEEIFSNPIGNPRTS